MKWLPDSSAPDEPGRKLGRMALLLVLLAALGLMAIQYALPGLCPWGGGGAGAADAQGPAGAPASPAGAGDGAATRPADGGEAAPPLTRLQDLLRLTPEEQDAYSVALSRPAQLDEPALTLWMDRVSRMPQLGPEQLAALDRPAIPNLAAYPQRYAGVPLRLEVYVFRVIRWEAGREFTPTKWWPASRGAIWRIDCLNAASPTPYDEPVYVLAPFDPRPLLGKPAEVLGDDEFRYEARRKIGLAGVFYKTFRDRAEEGEFRYYPVVLAWQMEARGGRGAGPLSDQRLMLILGFVLLLVFAFVLLRAKLKRPAPEPVASADPAARWGPKYRPLRDLADEAAGQPGREPPKPPPPPPEEDPGEVDPDLKAAAEQYRREHGDDGDGAEHPR